MNRRLSVAPMMDWSDRHCRMFWRQLTRQSLLYTEMVTTGAILHAGPDRFLTFDQGEHPIALQLGGSNPQDLAKCAKIAEDWHFDEVNLNCGCPSDRVQSGMFGACLMAHPQLVADCIKAMQDSCSLPVTVKHRIGIDDMESYGEMVDFIRPIMDSGCSTFIVHARKAWLQGLSPKQNREIPPLNYDMVYQLKQDFPQLEVIINGGITDLEQSVDHLKQIDGVMLGRAAYHDPYILAEADNKIFADGSITKSREQVLLDFIPYIEEQLTLGVPLNHISRHVLGLFQGVAGAKIFRRHISQQAHIKGAGIEVIEQALTLMNEARQRSDEYQNQKATQSP
ncbi:tRNA dihydrouridine(20/20a) synthase DusA [Oceanicoccus sp. KOV_DT_Chl]|uniref:tRNA dihydrouridine(20/20a) synthase DusA n=1 Tax=Oceanicoccus sp. KOV_DT_Chl TaxID=1904639 RepID=UPI000C7AECE8|nr:tRNA dihydrouridine(20/20a) synthase DusA [Oceanicoccus sp. KOV_DT_Chl]